MAEALAAPNPAPRGAAWQAGPLPPLAVLGLVFFYPLALIGAEALGLHGGGAPAPWHAVFGSTVFQHAMWHTVEIAALSSGGCLVLGLTIALTLSFVPFPGARLLAGAVDTFIALPTFLVALAFTFLYGSAGMLNGALMELLHSRLPPVDFLYSRWGVILAEITVYTPFVVRPLLAAFSLLDRAQIEVAASLGARPLRILREVILPAAIPALLAGGSLCLLLTVNEFGIVVFIGAKDVITLPMLIYDRAIQEFDYPSACVIALVNIALSVGLYAVYRRLLGRLGRA